MTRTRRRRRAGFASHWIVLAFTVAIGSVVLASEATVGPFYKEQQRLRFSEEAFVLAESGLVVAHSQLARGGTFAGLDSVPLGHGRVSVKVERVAGDEVLVVATGTVSAAAVAGPGGTLSRRVRARLRVVAGASPVVLDWKDGSSP